MADFAERIFALSPNKLELLKRRLKKERESPISKLPRRLSSERRAQSSFPLSFAQERLWFLNQFQPGLPVYNIPMPLRWPGPLNVVALEQSLNEIMRRHETLRTTFQVLDGPPVQIIAPARPVPLRLVDLRSMPRNTREAEAQRLAAKEAEQVFDLAKGPLFRSLLVRLDDADHLLLLNMHHIVSDGWSIGVLLQELTVLYEAYSSGRPSPLPELPIQYADFAQWQREYVSGEVLESHLSYWRQRLEGAPAVLELPTDRLRPAVQTFQGAWQSFVVEQGVNGQLKQLSQREGVTLFMTLFSAFKTLLYRYTGQEDLVVGTPIANRNRAEIEGLIGFFANTLVLRTHLAGNPSFQEVLGQVREVTLGAYAHQDLPFEKLVEELQPERNLAYNPLFQVMFVHQNAPTMRQATSEPSRETLEPPPGAAVPTQSSPHVTMGTAKFDLTLSMAETAAGLMGTFEYNTGLFEHETITRMIGHFQTLLAGIAAAPEQRVSDLPLLTDAERKQLLVEWNDTKTPFPEDACIHELFEAQAQRTPEAMAVVFGDQQLSYRELNHRANQLAHYLQKLGVGPEVRVGICVERSLEMVVGVLGILKAGGAYIPLDPAYPTQRLAFMLEDAQVPVLVTQERLRAGLPESTAQVVCLDSEWGSIAKQSKVNPAATVKPDNLAYVIYTSGSTGRPKGIMAEHRGLCNLAEVQAQNFRLGPGEHTLQFFSISFDGWMWDFLLTLPVGATLHLAADQIRLSGPALIDYVREQGITTMTLLPSVLATLPIGPLPRLRTVIVAGESCSAELVAAWSKYYRFFNAYGPTETSVAITWGQCQAGNHPPSIGRPIANNSIFVLDRYLQPVPVGAAGELYIGGVAVTRGYLRNPALTAERYIPDPFGGTLGTRLLKTGDLARYLRDGTIVLLGRIDDLVKVRGYRVQLGEIEALMRAHPAVADAVAVAYEDTRGDKRLVGYVVPRRAPISTETIDDIRCSLAARLPKYMLPAALIPLEHVPRTPNGKLDIARLPTVDVLRQRLHASFIAPSDSVQNLIANVWKEVLGLDSISVDDDFFELGGHSLSATLVASKLSKLFCTDLPVNLLFEAPTIAELALAIRKHGNSAQANGEGAFERFPANDEEVLTRLDEMSDADVDALLIEMLNNTTVATPAQDEKRTNGYEQDRSDAIAVYGSNEEILARLDELSDECVDSLLEKLSVRENK